MRLDGWIYLVLLEPETGWQMLFFGYVFLGVCVCVCFWEALETQQDSIWKPREASDLLYPNIIKT